jgi:uncharacterized protein (TIGR02145 family)
MKSIISLTATIALAITLTLTACEEKEAANIKDSRDGKTYKTVKIGEQVWMAENLNYNANGSVCYNGEEANCKKYGRMYNWETAMKACPSGWHLPSNEEWDILTGVAGGENSASNLKATNGWDDGGNGNDKFGFSALPGGGGSPPDCGDCEEFGGVGNSGSWWSSTSDNKIATFAYYKYIYYNNEDLSYRKDDKGFFYSVRCIKD